jgi:hypothetical protein
MENKEEYFLATDNDLHWHIVPLSKQQEWDEWTNLSSGDGGLILCYFLFIEIQSFATASVGVSPSCPLSMSPFLST